MSEAALVRVERSGRRPLGATIWFVWMVAMWLAFLAALIADHLDDVWRWVRDLPLLVELVLWVLTLPWLLATAVWESSWPTWLRAALVVTFAAAWTLISIPRAKAGKAGEP
jgi:hypothetical protein